MTVTLDGPTLFALAGRRDVAAAFPFLAALRVARPGCCGAVAYPPTGPALKAVFALPPARKAVLKRLIGADRVVGSVVRGGRVSRLEL